jgi:uncharacterized protein (TIGR03067 family)
MHDPQRSSEPVPPPSGAPAPRPNALPDSARIHGGSVRLVRVWGIDVLVHWSWFVFAILRLQPTGPDDPVDFAHYDSQIWYGVEYMAIFGIVLLHEFGHVLACRSVGGIANRIVLWPLGGVAYVDPPSRPAAFLWSIAAGPLVNVALVVPTVAFWLACGGQDTDLGRFAAGLAWLNGYMLLFNLLPVYPLDGGQILQALLWFVMGRSTSLLVTSVSGLVTTVGLLAVAVTQHLLALGVLAGFGLLFCLVGIQGARGLNYIARAPRRTAAACANCGSAPPVGQFWACSRCWARFDAFATGGTCPNCSTPQDAVLCAACGRSRPYAEWRLNPSMVPPVAPKRAAPRPPTRAQRAAYGLIGAVLALSCCGLPNVEKQPLGLIIWTAAGAIGGAMSAATMTRLRSDGQARNGLRGSWRLAEQDGQVLPEGAPRLLKVKYPTYEEWTGERRDAKGTCWTDAMTVPPAISLTPTTGPDAGHPRPGIFRLDGKVLTICIAHPGQPRPTEFVSLPDVQHVQVYQRDGK